MASPFESTFVAFPTSNVRNKFILTDNQFVYTKYVDDTFIVADRDEQVDRLKENLKNNLQLYIQQTTSLHHCPILPSFIVIIEAQGTIDKCPVSLYRFLPLAMVVQTGGFLVHSLTLFSLL